MKLIRSKVWDENTGPIYIEILDQITQSIFFRACNQVEAPVLDQIYILIPTLSLLTQEV